ncbi:MAG: PriCT-2 domain-containing protein [Candidatus Omnitrophota bacterium]
MASTLYEPMISVCDRNPSMMIARSTSDACHALDEFLRSHANAICAPGAKTYQFLNRVGNQVKYQFLPIDCSMFFERLDRVRADKCPMHFVERVTDDPAGLMIDVDRDQDDCINSIFDDTVIMRINNEVANIITSILDKSIIKPIEQTYSIIDFDDAQQPSDEASRAQDKETEMVSEIEFHIFIIKRSSITKPPDKQQYRDGIHVLVPDLWFDKKARQWIVEVFKKQASTVFTDMSADLAQSMVDSMSAKVQPHLLGSCKPNGVLYDLTSAVRVSVTRESKTVMPIDVNALLSGQTMTRTRECKVINLVYELSLTQYAQRINNMETWLHKRIAPIAPDKLREINGAVDRMQSHNSEYAQRSMRVAQEREFSSDFESIISSDPHAEYIHNLLNALPADFAHDYDKWINVLMAISHESIIANKPEYMILAQVFSMSDAEKWNEASFARCWDNLCKRISETMRAGSSSVGNLITLRSLEYWVRSYNPQAFIIIGDNDTTIQLRKSIYDNHGAITNVAVANALVRLFHGRFVTDTSCVDRTMRAQWFEFIAEDMPPLSYKWRANSEPHSIHKFIVDRIIPLCRSIKKELEGMLETTESERGRTHINTLLKKLPGAIQSLESDRTLASIINQLKHRVNIDGFIATMDKEPFVIGTTNGVLEFLPPIASMDVCALVDSTSAGTSTSTSDSVAIAQVMKTRDFSSYPRLIRGYHNHRIMSYVQCDYAPYDESNPFIADILGAYRDIYIDRDVCEFILFYLSTWLDLCDSQRMILLLGGGGSNGKTWSVYFPQNVLGSAYVKVLKMQLLTDTSRASASAANPALMRLKGCRGGYFDEANEGDVINPANMKALVTPGDQSARDLYSSEEQFRNTANTIAISNYDFVINATDCGTWDRLRYYVCRARFVDNPDPRNPCEKKKRPELTNDWIKDARYKSAMFAILVHYRFVLERDYGGYLDRVPIPTITRETAEFRRKQDPVMRFISERIVKSPDAQPLSIRVIVDGYISWYRELNHSRPQNVAGLETAFQNSIIGPSYIKMDETNGEYFAHGLRLREARDRIGRDESLVA